VERSKLISEEEAKNKKKWERLVVKTYKQKIQIDCEELFEKLQEKYSSEEEVKNIISELKIKIKDHEYLFKKQWQILKKFNLQEKIYREESKNLIISERMKKEENYQEAIEKLTAAHVGGFEPASVIKNKIMVRIQQKFDINEETMHELKKIDFDYYFKKDARENKIQFISEEQLLKKRHDDQVGVLEKFIKVNFLAPGKDNNTSSSAISNKYKDKDRDRDYDSLPNYHQNKQELKRYEKELEMKAGKGGYSSMLEENHEEEFGFIEKFESLSSRKNQLSSSIKDDKLSSRAKNDIFNSLSSNTIVYSNFDDITMKPFDSDNLNNLQNLQNLKNEQFQFNHKNNKSECLNREDAEDKFPTPGRFDSNIKVKDFLKLTDPESITRFKEKVIEDIKEKTESNKDLYEDDFVKSHNTFYRSKILNDLYVSKIYLII
jgi:hypothetical protein